MFKKFFAASAATAALCSTALAADLPRRAAPVLVPVAPAFTWTGFYIGGHAGYSFNESNTITTVGNNAITAGNVAANLRPGSLRFDREGFVGGGQVGFNYQVGFAVFGVEADISYVDVDESVTFFSARAGANPTDRSVFRQRIDYLGTVRGRLGFTFDRVLVYGTGGFAYADVRQDVDFFQFNSGLLQFQGRRSDTETGYAVGGGIEYALPTDSFLNVFNSSAVTIRGEYLYYNLGRQNVAVPGIVAGPGITAANASGYTSSFETDGHIARAAINFKFGGL